MSEASDLRPLLWVASSKRDFIEMPEDVIRDFGHWLFQVQKGKTPKNAKSLSGFGGTQVMELWRDHADGTFRTIYTVKYAEVVIILHAFQKKSKKGIETPIPRVIQKSGDAKEAPRFLVRRSRRRSRSTPESWPMQAEQKAVAARRWQNRFLNHERYKQDIDLVHSRLKLAEILYRHWKEKGAKK